MLVCATQNKTNFSLPSGNLFLPVPDTDFRDYLDELDEVLRFAPEIVAAIEQDLDIHARKKKHLRMEDRRFFESRTGDLPHLDIRQRTIVADELTLAVGRPRMPGNVVYLFLMLRGFLGSLSSKSAQRFLRESMSLHALLQERELNMPGWTTILENVNLVSLATRELILDKQIEFVLKESLDDFKESTIDSTAVKANSSWPTDGKILTGLLGRVHRLGQKLHILGLQDFRKGWVPRWLDEMDKLEFQICLSAGKPHSRGKLKKHYRKLLRKGGQAADSLRGELARLEEGLKMNSLPPSSREFLKRVLERIRNDIADAKRVVEYAADRVFHGKQLPSTEKVLSLSDGSAGYIKKGGRDPVIGYKPQLVRSKNGFVTSLMVPQGNAADSIKLVPAIRESIERTGVIAELVSTDDGYASAKGRGQLLKMGVKILSISGAKGKKLTDPQDWDSDVYRDARRNRSAVESLMFTIKDGFEFGELGRRGIDAVRNELLEKVLAYNCCRITLVRKRHLEKLKQAA
ncbi:MAG: transposase [Verrucomicrobia bacterium]|nr:transposase [Verrucomicrobiota bacterium]MDA1066233.1 transposase [Verrucomicrobiota bacterium]